LGLGLSAYSAYLGENGIINIIFIILSNFPIIFIYQLV